MITQEKNTQSKATKYSRLMQEASNRIAPLWPLDRFVAVNPFLGNTHRPFDEVAKDLYRKGGIQMTLPASYYLEQIRSGKIAQSDLEKVFEAAGKEAELEEILQQVSINSNEIAPLLPTVALSATELIGKDWTRFVVNRISNWAASYFDVGQASWVATFKDRGIFASWKADASIDMSAELTGLPNFRKIIKALPDDPFDAARISLEVLQIPEEGLVNYFERLMYQTTGWSAHVARLDWETKLGGGEPTQLDELLAILICWEAAMLQCLNGELSSKWKTDRNIYFQTEVARKDTKDIADRLLLQEAHDAAVQRSLINRFKAGSTEASKEKKRPKAQAVFCIDVRSEVFRRNLELADPGIETLGFAGFFGFPISYIPIGHEISKPQCPVLLNPGPVILEEAGDGKSTAAVLSKRRYLQQFKYLWKGFKSGAVSCFSFVSPLGMYFLPKLLTDSFGWTRPVPHPDAVGLDGNQSASKGIQLQSSTNSKKQSGIPLDQQVTLAKNALKGMSLDQLAPFVMIIGHGSQSVNNPHATGYDCGACGGHSGEANAKVAAAVLNNPQVRQQLADSGVIIPDETIFLAGLHDTTTDNITLYNTEEVPTARIGALKELQDALHRAGHGTRAERGLRMALDQKESTRKIMERAKDWSQTRHEWGLAGCSSFIVAPRERTTDKNLNGQSFLHNYDWKKDEGFGVLELIMTAPMVVTSWINLQYFASTVDNHAFGSGNKTLHNVTAGIGVLEGQSGDLRTGLPWQAIHDGVKYQHDPNRLNVVIEAPIDAMNTVLAKHSSVKDLCDNQWIFLMAMDEEGKIAHRYKGNLEWEEVI